MTETKLLEGGQKMENSLNMRIDGSQRQWGGNNSPQGDKKQRRQHKLNALFESLNAGDIESARLAFVALVNFDATISGDPYLSKIGAALQSCNLYAAQHFATELKNRGGQLQELVLAPKPVHSTEGSGLYRTEFLKIDLSA
jgi:hypothetical protein